MKNPSSGKSLAKYAILLCSLLFVYYINFLFVYNGLDSLHDFGSFIASGQLANEGKNPYSNDSPLVFNVDFTGINLESDAPNLNPPISVILFQNIANIEPFISINFWRIVSVLLFFGSLIILHTTFPASRSQAFLRFAWALSMAGFWHTIQLGQIYTAMLLFTVLTWVFLKKDRFVYAGICLGILIAIKPNFVFWAVLLLLAGNWKTFLSAGISAFSISIIPALIHGIDIYRQWLEASAIYTPNLLLFPGNNSFQGLTSRVEQPNLGILLSVIVAVAVAWYVFKNRPDTSKLNSLGIIVSLLISPIAWTGYTLEVLPIFFAEEKWDWKFNISAVIFSIPVIFPLVFFQTSFANFVIFGWLYGWGLLVLVYGMFFEPKNLRDKLAAKISSIHTN